MRRDQWRRRAMWRDARPIEGVPFLVLVCLGILLPWLLIIYFLWKY